MTRLSADGTALVWSSYYGGKVGNRLAFDVANGVALDPYDSVYLVGETLSRDLPVSPTAFDVECGKNDNCTQTDAFAAKLSADGCGLLYGTYLGGMDSDAARAVAVDAQGHASVVGFTRDKDFPVTDASTKAGGSDAFLTELDPAASQLAFSTYLGSQNDDAGHGGTPAELYYRQFLTTFPIAYVACISEAGASESAATGVYAGKVTRYIKNRLDRRAYDFYLCGRQDMVRDVTLLADAHFPASHVYTEVFY